MDSCNSAISMPSGEHRPHEQNYKIGFTCYLFALFSCLFQ